jgi:hypothetical protein
MATIQNSTSAPTTSAPTYCFAHTVCAHDLPQPSPQPEHLLAGEGAGDRHQTRRDEPGEAFVGPEAMREPATGKRRAQQIERHEQQRHSEVVRGIASASRELNLRGCHVMGDLDGAEHICQAVGPDAAVSICPP